MASPLYITIQRQQEAKFINNIYYIYMLSGRICSCASKLPLRKCQKGSIKFFFSPSNSPGVKPFGNVIEAIVCGPLAKLELASNEDAPTPLAKAADVVPIVAEDDEDVKRSAEVDPPPWRVCVLFGVEGNELVGGGGSRSALWPLIEKQPTDIEG